METAHTYTIPVIYSANPDHLFYGRDEFGDCVAILARSWGDAWEELAEFALERDGACDHGDDPAITSDDLADELCDCEWADSGRVWMVYYNLHETGTTLERFELAHGADAERIATL